MTSWWLPVFALVSDARFQTPEYCSQRMVLVHLSLRRAAVALRGSNIMLYCRRREAEYPRDSRRLPTLTRSAAPAPAVTGSGAPDFARGAFTGPALPVRQHVSDKSSGRARSEARRFPASLRARNLW